MPEDIITECGPAVSLWWGGSFAGSYFGLEVGGEHYSLGQPGELYCLSDAKERAAAILAEKHPGLVVDLDGMKFRWTGTL